MWCKVSQQAGSPQTACSRAMSCLQGFHSLASKQTHRKKCFDIIFLAQLMILIALTHLCQRAQQLQRCDSDSPLRFQKGTLPFGGSRSCLPSETPPRNRKPHVAAFQIRQRFRVRNRARDSTGGCVSTFHIPIIPVSQTHPN